MSSSDETYEGLPELPFVTPLVAPAPRVSMAELESWLEARAAFVNHFNQTDGRVYQKVRARRNARLTYVKKVSDPDTGELACLRFSDKAAVSIP